MQNKTGFLVPVTQGTLERKTIPCPTGAFPRGRTRGNSGATQYNWRWNGNFWPPVLQMAPVHQASADSFWGPTHGDGTLLRGGL